MEGIAILVGLHGLVLVFCIVLAQQAGAPIPAMPLLLLAGAATVERPLYASGVLLAAILACLIANLGWFWAGRRYGYRVLKLLCGLTLSPDSCVRQTETGFERHRAATLVLGKFVPGLARVAPPLAGALGTGTLAFIVLNGAGSVLWVGVGLIAGLVFHTQIGWLLDQSAALGDESLFVVAVVLVLYLVYRWSRRHRFLASLRAVRIDVDELHRLMEAGAAPLVLDARGALRRRLDGHRIPGAQSVDLDDLSAMLSTVALDRDVVVYCDCPNEASAVKVVRLLRDHGLRRARPLKGGLEAWIAAGFAVEDVADRP